MRSVYSALLVLITGTALLAYSIRQEYSKTIIKEFAIAGDGRVQIDNIYGPVQINTWTQNRVKTKVTITVRASSEQRAEHVFDDITIDFDDARDWVSVETQIDEDESWWGRDNEKKDFSIRYEVWLPASVELDIANKYGDLTIAEMQGKARIHLKYGNLQMPALHNDLQLEFSHGTGQLGRMKDIEGQLSYCNLQLEQARDLRLETEYSNLQIQEAGDLFINAKYNNFSILSVTSFDYEGRYDVVEIGQVDHFQAIAKYSDFHVGNLRESGSFDLEFGLAQIDQLESGFSELSLVGRFTDYQLDIESGTNYQLEAAADYAGISYPASLQVTYEQESSTYHEVEGYHGSRQSASVIKAQLNYGGLKLTD